ncbi:SDR family NAD(P)-dependent oxidoreductase [Sphingopyxis terrae]|uniref:SDR family NAD(P)-dependent oxidoreductase n=1 Tax=Sphingopyxis terrae TaxID=33052 RepID=UPI002A0AC9D2|nr:SDR family NAD(P)-dependent oxidoreductase [Sphingopyxis terrae]MDX8356396.1 SDR family oxidoreductase [Sphingopyxis terrae]
MMLEGRIAIITGAAHGLGAATAKRFVEEGARVVVTDIDFEGAQEVAQALGDRACALMLDVREEEQWLAAIELARSRFGGFDTLVNNAGISSISPIETNTMEEWRAFADINAGGVFLGCKSAFAAMKEGAGGVIVNISSNSTILGFAEVPMYSSLKASINTLTRSIAARCRRDKLPIRCNTVVPGGMVSNMARDTLLSHVGVDIYDGSDAARSLLENVNIVDPVEVADVIVVMASNLTRRINGAEIIADGGDTEIIRAG